MSSDLGKTFFIWQRLKGHQAIDLRVEHFLSDFIDCKHRSWLKDSRLALFLTMEQVALQMGVNKQTYSRLEKSETKETISISSLSRAAEAMGCELVYGIRPKERQVFSARVWKRFFPEALRLYQRRTRLKKIKPLILAKIAGALMTDPQLRREKNWARNCKPSRKLL